MINKARSLPEGVEKFILTHFETLTQVEVLCFLFENKQKSFTKDSLCSLLYLSETLIQQTLEKLLKSRLISKSGDFYIFENALTLETKNLISNLSLVLKTRKSIIVEILFDSFLKG